MKLPRSLSGAAAARLLARHYGYSIVRNSGSHMTLMLKSGEESHSLTVPRHQALRVGTLDSIIGAVASFHGISKPQVRQKLFGKS